MISPIKKNYSSRSIQDVLHAYRVYVRGSALGCVHAAGKLPGGGLRIHQRGLAMADSVVVWGTVPLRKGWAARQLERSWTRAAPAGHIVVGGIMFVARVRKLRPCPRQEVHGRVVVVFFLGDIIQGSASVNPDVVHSLPTACIAIRDDCCKKCHPWVCLHEAKHHRGHSQHRHRT